MVMASSLGQTSRCCWHTGATESDERVTKSNIFGVVVLGAVACAVASAAAVDCTQTSVGLTPLNEFAPSQRYLGTIAGGLYPSGSNEMPLGHLLDGLVASHAIAPRLVDGALASNGRIVLMSIGMSNTTQEWCGAASVTQPCGPTSFMAQAAPLDSIDWGHITLVDGAKGGQTSSTWDAPTDPNYDRIRDSVLTPLGLAEAQVQAVWVKVANSTPTISLPNSGADALVMKGQIGAIARAVKVRYPNVRLMFVSNRIYGGYATTALNPEPYAYESGFAVKWAIAAQIEQLAGAAADPATGDLSLAIAPHLSWGPNLWGDGMTPRSDGLIWACSDFSTDGTHPAASGRGKVAALLVNFFRGSALAADWFLAAPPIHGDIDRDGRVGGSDMTLLLASWGGASGTSSGATLADLDESGMVDGADLAQLLSDWTP